MNQSLQRRLATGANSIIVTILAVAAILVVVELAHRYSAQWDFSEASWSTLQADTKDTLAELEQTGKQVEVVAFASQNRNLEARFRNQIMRDFLRKLDEASVSISTRFLSLDSDRALAEEYEVTAYGTLVITDGDNRVDVRERDIFKRLGAPGADVPQVDFRGEGAVARGISKLLSGEQRRVYLLSGHGERGLSDIGRLASLMDRQGWSVSSLNVLMDSDQGLAPSIPEDADALLVINPKTQATEGELLAVTSFIGQGGSVGLFLEPGQHVPPWLNRLGVRLQEGTIRDVPTVWPHEDWPVVRYGRHEMTRELIESEVSTVVGRAGALEVEPREGVRAETVLKTSHRGWLESGQERGAVFDEGVDIAGPLDVGVLLTIAPVHSMVSDGRVSRVAVFSDATFITDELMENLGNPTFGVNIVRWLVGEDENMGLVGRVGQMRNVTIEPATLTRIGWFVMGLWPLFVVLFGAFVWWNRRGR